MKKDAFLKMYSLLSTDIERFFQRYTSNIHHHNKIMMYISGIFIDLNVGRIRKMNSFNSIFFKIKNNKVFLRSKKCKILYNNIFNFTEGEQAFKDLMNMIFSTTFPVFELAQFNIKINFHNQKVLEIETDKPYKIFVFRNRKSVEKRFVNIISLFKSTETNNLYHDIIKHVSEEQKNNEENQKENDNEEKILRLLEMKRIAIVKEFGKSIEELVRESWLYSFNVINNIMSEKIFKSNTPVKEKDIKKTFFFIRSFLNELPSHVNSILRVFTKLITEKNIKMYNIDGLDSEVMKTMSSNFYIQKGMQNIYVFFKELISAETDINEMKKIVEKYNISIEVYHNGQLLHKQNIQDYFKVYENFIRSFKTSLKSRMNTLKIKKVKIKRSELSDHINDLFKNSIRFHNDIIKMPLSERKNHINFFIKYNVISEKIANYLLEDIQKRSYNK